MPTIKLTRRTIAALPATGRPVTWWDETLPGFGLQVRPTGSRSYVAEYRPGAGGRGVAKKRVVIGDPAELDVERARAAARDLLAKVRLGADPAAERAEERAGSTVKEVAEAYLERHVRTKRKPSTAAHYRGLLECHVYPVLGTKKASAVTRADVARLHEGIARKAEGPAKAGAKRGKATKVRGGRMTANRTLAVVKAMFSWATTAGLLPEDAPNPARGLEMFREEGRERFLSGEELGRLGAALVLAEGEGLPWAEVDESKPSAKHLPKPEQRVTRFDAHSVGAVRLLMFSGMRLREVLGLRWEEVDLGRGTIRLPDSKTGRKSVALGGPALAVLASLPRSGKFVISSTTAGTKEEAPRRDLKRIWTALVRHAGLDGVRLHDLRHGFASVGVGEEGLSLFQVGQLLGHARPETTARYSHLANDPQRRAADLIAGTIARATGFKAEVVDLASQRKVRA